VRRLLSTWAGRSEFEYDGSVSSGTTIYYGTGFLTRVSKEQYSALLQYFRGQTVNIGTSRDRAPEGSIGAWLQKYVTPVAIASYVGAILIYEGYASKSYERAMIKIK